LWTNSLKDTIAILGELKKEFTYHIFIPMGQVDEGVSRPYNDPSKDHQYPSASPHANIYDFDPTNI